MRIILLPSEGILLIYSGIRERFEMNDYTSYFMGLRCCETMVQPK